MVKHKDINIVFTDQGGPLINRVLGLKWTHVLVKFGDRYYEATWPRVKRSDSFNSVAFHVETVKVSDSMYDRAELYAWSQIGRRYNFWGYFFPRWYGKTRGVYCSQFVCEVLRRAGVPLPPGAGWSPDKLLKALKVYL